MEEVKIRNSVIEFKAKDNCCCCLSSYTGVILICLSTFIQIIVLTFILGLVYGVTFKLSDTDNPDDSSNNIIRVETEGTYFEIILDSMFLALYAIDCVFAFRVLRRLCCKKRFQRKLLAKLNERDR
jgi:hypothetical protein